MSNIGQEQGGATKKKYGGGEHGKPMIYGVALDGADAWLVNFTGDGWKHTLERTLQCREREPAVDDCAEALWLEGAHPESMLMVWRHGSPTTNGKVTMLGTAVLSGIVPRAPVNTDP